MRNPAIVLALVAGMLTIPTAASADGEYEPNNDIATPTPLGPTPLQATVENSVDEDWYRVTLAGSQQVTFAVTPLGPASCSNFFSDFLRSEVLDHNGDVIGEMRADFDDQNEVRYTTPTDTREYYIRVYTGTACHYSVSVTPESAHAPPFAQPPRVTVPEPNDTPEQAFGPISGDVYYEGKIDTENDMERVYLYARPFTKISVEITDVVCESSGGRVAATAFPEFSDREVADTYTNYPGTRSVDTFRSASSGGLYSIKIDDGSLGGFCSWQLLVTPAHALLPSADCSNAISSQKVLARAIKRAKARLQHASSRRQRRHAKRELKRLRHQLQTVEATIAGECV